MIRELRLASYFLIGFLLSAVSVFSYAAGSVALQVPANVASSAGSYVSKAGATFSGAAFNSAMTAQVAGKAVTVPATWRLASNAGQFAVAAVRLNPTALVVGSVAAWLIGKGLTYANGQWTKPDPLLCTIDCFTWGAHAANGVYKHGTSAQAALDAMLAYARPLYGTTYEAEITSSTTFRFRTASYLAWNNNGNFSKTARLPDPAGTIPVVESDFTAAAATAPSDAAATQLASLGLPLAAPEIAPAVQSIPLSDPYYDPVTKTYQKQIATVTTNNNSTTINYTITNQTVTQAGAPVLDPVTNQTKDTTPPDEPVDPCDSNPDRVGCLQVGTPTDEPALQTQNQGVTTLTPVSLTQNNSCPANITLPKNMFLSWQPICTAATMLNPLILAFAWLSAGLIVIGAAKNG